MTQGELNNANELSVVLPFKIEPDLYYTTKITIVPHFVYKKIQGFVIKLIPIHPCESLNFNVFIACNGIYEKDNTIALKKQLLPPNIKFTLKQNAIVNYIQSGITATEIAFLEGKALNSIYKINRKILEKISKYYDIDFKEAKEAVSFYFNSFT